MIMSRMTVIHWITMAALVTLLVTHSGRTAFSDRHHRHYDDQLIDDDAINCPPPCDCSSIDLSVDCSHRGLTSIPKGIPVQTKQLNLEGNNLTIIKREDFSRLSNLKILQLKGNQISFVEPNSFDDLKYLEKFSISPVCPYSCSCHDGVVDCRGQNLTKIPENIPENTIELRLEQNFITEVPSKAFGSLKKLRRIDLSKNNITKLAPDAFSGLKALNSLFLFGNQITDLPEGVFKGLINLQILLLNANSINCIRREAFVDLQNLNLLSLYDNSIESLADGLFSSLINIQTLHLGRNPFICDCNLRWLAEYLRVRPTLETSEARCEEPRRNAKKRISQLHPDKFKCKGTEEYRTKYWGEQCHRQLDSSNRCPESCTCEGTIVDCSKKELRDIPNDIPAFATEIRLNDNYITKIRNTGLFKKLPNLIRLDLRHNQISDIEDGAFQGASRLNDLFITENKLRLIRPKMFAGLKNITNLMLRTNMLTCITNDSFADLENLKLLSLYDNKIRCVQPGSFDRMKHLTTLNLLANPLNCNCHMKWLSQWLKHHDVVTGNPKCQSPDQLKDVPIEDVQLNDFRCDQQDDQSECEGDSLCPSKCTCTGTQVRCSRQKLSKFPSNIQPITTELYLDVNDISSVPQDINQLNDLIKLDLSNNKLSILIDGMFSNLTNLQTLILSYNKLQCIQSAAFSGLTSLRVLSLHGNDISMIPDGTFNDLKSLSHIALGSNPLYCDCHLKWLAQWIQRGFVEGGVARCQEPKMMKDKLIMSAPPNHFICTEDTEPQILAKCDACYTFPCLNGATCRSLPLRNYECHCTPGYHGSKCEHKIDACFGQPCENSGTCKVMEMGRFSCHCPSGFEGDRCQINIDDCEENKCENNSTCIDGINSYQCQCQPGFQGEYCEKKMHFCQPNQPQTNPCQNGATCLDMKTHYQCLCLAGFSGENCSINQDDCQDNLCQNGASCQDGINEYSCQCLPGFTGKYCEFAPIVELYPQTSPCQQHDCVHGACFVPSGSSDYICKCSPGYSGKRCQILSSLSFHSSSFIEFDPLKTVPSVNISMKFATTKQSGVILYQGDQEHVAIELFKGRIRISLDVGNYPVSTMFSYETVNDGKYHSVEFLLIKKNFTMRVDGGSPRTIINEGIREYLDVKTPLFIGGLPDDAAQKAFKQWHIWNASSLEGCMREIYLNGKAPDLSMAHKQHQILPGCTEFDDVNLQLPCRESLCQKGKCVPSADKRTYECKCHRGWSGPFCDQPPTCQKEVRRDFFTESGCRSTKKLKLSSCTGSCGDQCCKPLKMKKRQVRMACSDGSKFVKEIEIIRKCGCARKCGMGL